GSGKSTLGRAILRLVPITSGHMRFDKHELTGLGPAELKPIRRHMQMIVQYPFASLNPRMTVYDTLAEPLLLHRIVDKQGLDAAVFELMDSVGLSRESVLRYPHEFSGGQRQRIAIGRAIATKPRFIIADEPVSALDVTIQAQILDLILALKEEMNTAVMMITHDLGVVAETTQQVNVMYAGRIVEQGLAREIFAHPRHPYTRSLLAAVPRLGEKSRRGRRRLQEIPGIVPSLFDMPRGCSFSPRCPLASARCRECMPDLRDLDSRTRVRCHLISEGEI
ncbi:MAG: ABC transporter ATP-binding protein, partial [Desulfobacterales bacterium]|nr:ABC transporter ATP-binding protein [Desulfobacterales bacterium]